MLLAAHIQGLKRQLPAIYFSLQDYYSNAKGTVMTAPGGKRFPDKLRRLNLLGISESFDLYCECGLSSPYLNKYQTLKKAPCFFFFFALPVIPHPQANFFFIFKSQRKRQSLYYCKLTKITLQLLSKAKLHISS